MENNIMDNYTNKTVLLTGFSGAIGYNLALELCRSGAKVIATDKTSELCEKAKEKLLKEFSFANVSVFPCDFLNLKNIALLAENIKGVLGENKLDFIIHCAGVFSKWQKFTDEANEMNFQVNYLAPYLLTSLLTDNLNKSESGKVVLLGNKYLCGRFNKKYFDIQNFKSLRTYKLSKLCLKLFAHSFNDTQQSAQKSARAIYIKGRIANTEFFTKNNTGMFKNILEKFKDNFISPSLAAMDIAEAIKTSVNTGATMFKGRKAIKFNPKDQFIKDAQYLNEYSKKLTKI